MPSIAAITIFVFGITSLYAGCNGLLYPQSLLKSLNLPNEDATEQTALAMALAAIAMGLYYPLAAYQGNRPFFFLTVPMRLLTATVFWRNGGSWKAPAVWEGLGAVLTGLALLWESRRKKLP